MDTQLSTDIISSVPTKEQVAAWHSLTREEQSQLQLKAIEEAESESHIDMPADELEDYIRNEVLSRRAKNED